MPRLCAVMYCGGESDQGHVIPLTNQMIAHLSIVRVKTRLKWHSTNLQIKSSIEGFIIIIIIYFNWQ